jgi:hypothetical protein
MALWDKLKDGIDRVEKVATHAVDEGKTRLDARRAQQAAEQAAAALGWATYRAWEASRPLDPETLDRLARALREHEQEARRLEAAAGTAAEWRRRSDGPAAGPSAASPTSAAPSDAAATGPAFTGERASGGAPDTPSAEAPAAGRGPEVPPA